MTKNAKVALRAATLLPKIGRFAARRMVERAGVPLYLYVLARQLQAAECAFTALKNRRADDCMA